MIGFESDELDDVSNDNTDVAAVLFNVRGMFVGVATVLSHEAVNG